MSAKTLRNAFLFALLATTSAASLMVPTLSSAEQVEAERPLSKGMAVDMYGRRYAVLDFVVEGSEMNWMVVADHIPKEILDRTNPALSAAEVLERLDEIRVPYMQKYERGVEALTEIIAKAYPNKNHGNLDLEVAEIFIMNRAPLLAFKYPEFKNQIDQLDQDHKAYSSILMLKEIVQANIDFKRDIVPQIMQND